MPGGHRGLQNRCGAVMVPAWFDSLPLRHLLLFFYLVRSVFDYEPFLLLQES